MDKVTVKALNKLVLEQRKLILQSKRHIESLKFINQSITQYIEKSDNVFYEMSLDLKKIINVNPAAKDIWKLQQSNLKIPTTTWFKTIHPEDRKSIKKALLDVAEGRKNELLLEYRLLYDDSSCSYIMDRVILLSDERGEPRSIMGFASNMTDYIFSKRRLFIYEQILLAHSEQKNNNLFFDTMLKIIATSFDWDYVELWVLDENKDFFYCTNTWTNASKYLQKYIQKPRK